MQVVAATNRIDILDPALLRSGRLDRKIEFPHPTEEARARILQMLAGVMLIAPLCVRFVCCVRRRWPWKQACWRCGGGARN